MLENLPQALHRAALIFGLGVCLAAIYCVAFALLMGRNAVELLPSIMLAYAVLAGLMLSRGVSSEQRNDPSGAANYYTRALGYHLVATAAYVVLSA